MGWFRTQCRDLCHDASIPPLFATISHDTLALYRDTLAAVDVETDENNGAGTSGDPSGPTWISFKNL